MPNSAALTQKEFARRLLASEVAAGKFVAAKNSPAFRVCERLREPLGKLLGVRGFQSLLSRALALAGTSVSWMRELRIDADGSLAGLEGVEAQLDSRVIAEGELVLVSELLGLLETFIGPALTLRLLCTIFGQTWTLAIFEKESSDEKK